MVAALDDELRAPVRGVAPPLLQPRAVEHAVLRAVERELRHVSVQRLRRIGRQQHHAREVPGVPRGADRRAGAAERVPADVAPRVVVFLPHALGAVHVEKGQVQRRPQQAYVRALFRKLPQQRCVGRLLYPGAGIEDQRRVRPRAVEEPAVVRPRDGHRPVRGEGRERLVVRAVVSGGPDGKSGREQPQQRRGDQPSSFAPVFPFVFFHVLSAKRRGPFIAARGVFFHSYSPSQSCLQLFLFRSLGLSSLRMTPVILNPCGLWTFAVRQLSMPLSLKRVKPNRSSPFMSSFS